MKIGIVTQPLALNYGGVLQNYALQKVLKDMGHDVYTINKRIYFLPYYKPWKDRVKWRVKQIVKKYIGREYYASFREFQLIRLHFTKFIHSNISATKIYGTQEQLRKIIEKYNFDAYVVGSDQVWRPLCTENIYDEFLSFCQGKKNKRVAYAASFGVDKWEFEERQMRECRRLAKMFDAISVREDSGVELCRKYLDVEAVHVLDPTLLLEKKSYIDLVDQGVEEKFVGDIFCYILDNCNLIRHTISTIEKKYTLKSYQVKEKKYWGTMKYGDDITDYVIPSPTKWLRAFMDAKIVLTDSFHGCVFSIIFNKPFWVIGNERRGNARFDSLLRLFNLENRRISIDEITTMDLMTGIEWEDINNILSEKREEAFRFLNQALQS